MFSRKKSTEQEGSPATKPSPPAAKAPAKPGETIAVSAWKISERTVRRAFPGPRGASALLRVAVERGAAASHGSTHVTFTQETWNHIHQSLERNYPKLQIVGWYHSHPGFGV